MRRSSAWRRQVALGLILLVVGMVCARLALTGEYASFVKPTMRPWLWLSAAAITIVGGWTLWRARTDVGAGDGHVAEGHEEHSHGRVALVGSLLLVPMLVLLLLPTPQADLYLARRGGGQPGAGPTSLAPLPEGNEVVNLRLDDYVLRSQQRPPKGMAGRTFRVVGFVVNETPGQPWILSRLKVTCCLGDALPFRVEALDAPPQPDNQWVEVVGTWEASESSTAKMRVQSVTPVAAPAEPFLT